MVYLARTGSPDHTCAALTPNSSINPMRRAFLAFLKVAVSVALLYFALRSTDFTALKARLSLGSIGWLILALAVTLIQTAIASARWYLLSSACGAALPALRAFRFNMIGTFFNQTLPSSIGGDAVRLWLLGRTAGWRAATYSIFVDRAIGLIALAVLILICLPWSSVFIADSKARIALFIIEAGALGAGVGFLMVGLLPVGWFDRWAPTHHIRRCSVIAARALTDGGKGAAICALSFTVHLLTIVVAWCAAMAIAAPAGFSDLLLLLPPVALITLVPISIAGWGLRETALGAAFASAGLASAEGINISLIYGAMVFLAGGLGGLVWILSAEKAEKGTKPIDVPISVP